MSNLSQSIPVAFKKEVLHEAFLDMNLNSNVDQLIVVAALRCCQWEN